eukprot:TRINITY_DN420_c0_g1_i1.p1 TRINITY_DN420_c0_g1~~TRINITY_DN420_c0_g1_i1.p1  ORF type:complete len:1662 (-),score=448.40 TRINITY_DN420_c0_g1_i1:60-4469(-)
MNSARRQGCMKQVRNEVTTRCDTLETNIYKAIADHNFSKSSRDSLFSLVKLSRLSSYFPEVRTVSRKVGQAMKDAARVTADSICQVLVQSDVATIGIRLNFLVQLAEVFCEDSCATEEYFPNDFSILVAMSIVHIENVTSDTVNMLEHGFCTELIEEKEVHSCLHLCRQWSEVTTALSKISASVRKLVDEGLKKNPKIERKEKKIEQNEKKIEQKEDMKAEQKEKKIEQKEDNKIGSKGSVSNVGKLVDQVRAVLSLPPPSDDLYTTRCAQVRALFHLHTNDLLQLFQAGWENQKSDNEISAIFDSVDRRSRDLKRLCDTLKDHPSCDIVRDFDGFISQVQSVLISRVSEISEMLSINAPMTESDSRLVDGNLKRFSVLSKFSKSLLVPEQVLSSFQQIMESLRAKTNHYLKQAADNLRYVDSFARALCDLKWHGMRFEMVSSTVNAALIDLSKRFLEEMGSDNVTKLCLQLCGENSGIGQLIVESLPILASYINRLFTSITLPWNDTIDDSGRVTDGIRKLVKCGANDTVNFTELDEFYGMFDQTFKLLISDHLGRDLQDFEILIRSTADRYRAKLRERMHPDEKDDTLVVQAFKGAASFIYRSFGGKIQKDDVKHDEKDVQELRDIKIPLDNAVKEGILDLTCKIFALWSLYSIETFNKGKVGAEDLQHARKPHPAQVVAVFRMLGIGYENMDNLPSSIHEVLTGQGKSLILGVASSVLSLLGFEVCVACYSKFLSERDYTDFRRIFEAIGVRNLVFYGTFQEVCERVLNQSMDVRVATLKFLKDGTINSAGTPSQTERILLIDEVDVFFDESFYGNLYLPVARLSSENVYRLAGKIWTDSSKRSFSAVTTLDEYKDVLSEFSGQKQLIDECIRTMLHDLKNFKPGDGYIVKDDQIGYKEQDGVSFSVVYGYKTMFAYFFEMDSGGDSKNVISEASCKAHTSFLVNCGQLSYVEIVHGFHRIIGVTGTLEKLSPVRSDAIEQEFAIRRRTYLPSVYGVANRTFNDSDTIVVPENEFFFTIGDQISKRRDVGQFPRPVLVFFETSESLNLFYNSHPFSNFKRDAFILNETHSADERKNIVHRATMAGSITLCTREYGRGVDFACRDKRVTSNNGVHVIQTFLSEDLAEEAQIQGRCARQADSGSYSLILSLPSLERFFPSSADFQDYVDKYSTQTDKYKVLNEKRNNYFSRQHENTKIAIRDARQAHLEGLKFLEDLSKGDVKKVQEFLAAQNKGPVEGVTTKTLCLFDATGSMSGLLANTKKTICKVFQDATEVFKAHNSPSWFAVQIAVYRNYNVNDNSLLQASAWEVKPENLRTFMNGVGPEGGMGNEAIEIGLQYANALLATGGLTQIILIGDVPPNTREEVAKRFKCAPRTKYTVQTYWEDELAKLKEHNIPVHAFYVHQAAKQVFTEIAQRTGGTSSFLDVNSEKGAELLKRTVTERILVAGAGSDLTLADALVKTYTARHT